MIGRLYRVESAGNRCNMLHYMKLVTLNIQNQDFKIGPYASTGIWVLFILLCAFYRLRTRVDVYLHNHSCKDDQLRSAITAPIEMLTLKMLCTGGGLINSTMFKRRVFIVFYDRF